MRYVVLSERHRQDGQEEVEITQEGLKKYNANPYIYSKLIIAENGDLRDEWGDLVGIPKPKSTDSIFCRLRFFFRYHKATILWISGGFLFYGIILPLLSLINPEPGEPTVSEQMLSWAGAFLVLLLILGFLHWKRRRRKKRANRPLHYASEGQIVSSRRTLLSRLKDFFI